MDEFPPDTEISEKPEGSIYQISNRTPLTSDQYAAIEEINNGREGEDNE